MSRRVVMSALALVLVVVVVVLATSGGGGSSEKYRFTAIFDTAQGIVPGQLVKVAGSRVGKVKDVSLTPAPASKARFTLEIDDKFAPFRDDASCKILPEGFISESFIQCDPGTPGRPKLAEARGSGVSGPTVPVSRTVASVQLQQVLDTFSLPVSERVRMLMTELGIASAGRGEDLNALLRRANPALTQTRRVLSILAQQRASISNAVEQTDGVLRVLAQRDRNITGFVDRATAVTRNTSAHQRNLQRGIRTLPPLLRQAKVSLTSLAKIGNQLSPTATALARSAGPLTRLENLADPLSRQVMPALRRLDPAFAATRRAAPSTTKLASDLKTSTATITPSATDLAALLENTRKTGGIEAVQNLIYSLASLTSGYDRNGHAAFADFDFELRCIPEPQGPGCNGKYNSPGKGQIPGNQPTVPSQARSVAQGKKISRQLPRSDQQGLKTVLDTLLGD